MAILVAISCGIAAAAPLRVVTLNLLDGLDAPGTSSYDSALAVLQRIDADVVVVQELDGSDITGSPSNLDALADDLALGLDPDFFQFVASNLGVFDTGKRSAVLSRFPIASSEGVNSPPGAKELSRRHVAVVIDVPGTDEDPTIIGLHLKCCLAADDPFRRAVEVRRALDYINSNSLTASDNIIIVGDFNLIGADGTFNSLPAGLPGSYVLGTDITFPVEYFGDPSTYFTSVPINAIASLQLNGSDNTSGSSTLDFIMASPALTSRPHATEIYNSVLDVNNVDGLPKSGSPLPAGTSASASDHFAVFGDFDLPYADFLGLSVSPATVAESDPPGSATLTVTVPTAPGPGESVEVTLISSDPTEAIPVQSMVMFTSGVSSIDVAVSPQADALLDGSQPVTFTVSAVEYGPANAGLTVTDSNVTEYTFTSSGQTIVEPFDAFDGSTNPAQWTVAGGAWGGIDDGSSTTSANYAYGALPESSLGVLLGGSAVIASAAYNNDSGVAQTALLISYDAEQWRSVFGGRPDSWAAEIIIGGTPTPLPGLEFIASTGLPPGPVAGGTTTNLSAVLSGIFVPDGDSFQLRFTASPGAGSGPLHEDVFLNEVHYDNAGADTGEFIEVVVGPGYAGVLGDLSVVFYSSTAVYGIAQTLDTFTLGETTATGHRVFSKLVSGIQNGPSAGMAIVSSGTVLHFLSYEGTILAEAGPASGMTSVDIGVRQDNPAPPAGTESLGLSGIGGEANDFSWTRFTGPFTAGLSNDAQTFVNPTGAQGIALDNISVTLLIDTDGDGDPDLTDLDDDNDTLPDADELALGTNPLLADSDGNGMNDGDEDFDGDNQSNAAEILVTLTNPLDSTSLFAVTVELDPMTPDSVILRYPTLLGRTYSMRRSHDLVMWAGLSMHSGDGLPAARSASGDPLESGNFFRVEVTLP